MQKFSHSPPSPSSPHSPSLPSPFSPNNLNFYSRYTRSKIAYPIPTLYHLFDGLNLQAVVSDELVQRVGWYRDERDKGEKERERERERQMVRERERERERYASLGKNVQFRANKLQQQYKNPIKNTKILSNPPIPPPIPVTKRSNPNKNRVNQQISQNSTARQRQQQFLSEAQHFQYNKYNEQQGSLQSLENGNASKGSRSNNQNLNKTESQNRSNKNSQHGSRNNVFDTVLEKLQANLENMYENVKTQQQHQQISNPQKNNLRSSPPSPSSPIQSIQPISPQLQIPSFSPSPSFHPIIPTVNQVNPQPPSPLYPYPIKSPQQIQQENSQHSHTEIESNISQNMNLLNKFQQMHNNTYHDGQERAEEGEEDGDRGLGDAKSENLQRIWESGVEENVDRMAEGDGQYSDNGQESNQIKNQDQQDDGIDSDQERKRKKSFASYDRKLLQQDPSTAQKPIQQKPTPTPYSFVFSKQSSSITDTIIAKNNINFTEVYKSKQKSNEKQRNGTTQKQRKPFKKMMLDRKNGLNPAPVPSQSQGQEATQLKPQQGPKKVNFKKNLKSQQIQKNSQQEQVHAESPPKKVNFKKLIKKQNNLKEIEQTPQKKKVFAASNHNSNGSNKEQKKQLLQAFFDQN